MAVGADDWWWFPASSFDTTSVLYLIYNTLTIHSGMRFTGAVMAQGATIDVCYVTVQAQSNESGTPSNTTLAFEDSDDPAAPVNYADASGRVGTTAKTDWDPISAFTAGSNYDTPSLVASLQEVVDRASFGSDAVILLFNEDSEQHQIRSCKSYNQSTVVAPKLHIEYTEAATRWGSAMHMLDAG